MAEKQKYYGESQIKEEPKKAHKFKLREKCVSFKNLSADLAFEIGRIQDLQRQIDSLVEGGIAVSNEFGDNPYISISQKALTEAFNQVWAKIEDITGESLFGISMAVVPDYFIGEDGALVHIVANTTGTDGIFEQLEFYANDQIIIDVDGNEARITSPVSRFECYFNLTNDMLSDDEAIIHCHAKIFGRPYDEYKTIRHYSSYWVGCGTTYTDVMTNVNIKPVTHHLRAAWDLTANEGDHIIIILGESLAPEFIRADINGIEIPFVQSTVTVNDSTYKVFTSEDTYHAGVINVDING